MTNKDIFESLNDISLELIEKAAPKETNIKSQKNTRVLKIILPIAAVIAVLLSVSACTLEAKEYNTAVEFFNEYDISTDGLSRKDIKAVYRDITTNSFSYSKTNDIIAQNSYLNHVSGFELSQNLNYSLNGSGTYMPDHYFYYDCTDLSDNTRYEIEQKYKKTGTSDEDCYEVFEKSIIKKYDGKKLLWKTETSIFDAYGMEIFDDCIMVFGADDFSENQCRAFMMKVSKGGKQLWTKYPEPQTQGFNNMNIQKIIQNTDKSFSVFWRENQKIYLSLFDCDGNETLLHEYDLEGCIKNAALLSDGYIIEAVETYPEYKDTFYILDKGGDVTDSFEYSDSESDCYFFDIKELGDKIYFSAYAVPKSENRTGDGHGEVADIAEYLFSNQIWEPADEETTKLLRENYTAVLFVCNRENIRPKEFYCIKGALGAKLTVNDEGDLIWYTDSISSIRFSPYTSAFTFSGTNRVYRYIFSGKDGSLIRSEKTDAVSVFTK